MTKEVFCTLLGEIDDAYVTEARLCKPEKRRPAGAMWAAAAACLCLILGLSSVLQPPPAADTEPMTALTLEEAADCTAFGLLFPSEILDGYVLEDPAGIYDGTVLKANFYNSALEDEMTIRIAEKEWFGAVELNTVRYRAGTSGGTEIYIGGGDYIIQYSFSRSDLSELPGFSDMVASAAWFHREG